MDTAGLRDRALVAFLLSTGCRISEALALDRLDWNTLSVIVRGKGDVERSVVITDRARTEVDATCRHAMTTARRFSCPTPPAGPGGDCPSAAPKPSAAGSACATRSPNCIRTGSGTPPAPSSRTNWATHG